MQIKNIFSTGVVIFLVGALGGVLSNYALNSVKNEENGFNFVEAQKRIAPAVVSIVQSDGGGGTGFIIDPSGIILTNKHVVSEDAQGLIAVLPDGTEFDVTVEAMDPNIDVAILRLTAGEKSVRAKAQLGHLEIATLGSSSELEIGEWLLAIGNALNEYENTVSAGILSAKGRKLLASDSRGVITEELVGLLQTDAAINPGNSGGPMVNGKGEVIGIATALDDEAESIGFAIPIDDVKPAIESWKRTGKIVHPMLGVQYMILNASKAENLALEVTHGALIIPHPEKGGEAIKPGSVAAKAGFKEMDVILAVDGKDITTDYSLYEAILRRQVGEKVTLKVWREGKTFEIMVELTPLPTSD